MRSSPLLPLPSAPRSPLPSRLAAHARWAAQGPRRRRQNGGGGPERGEAARRAVLPRCHGAVPQLQRAALRRAQRAPALPRLADRRGAEQLLHLDGETPPRAGFSRRAALLLPRAPLEEETPRSSSRGPQALLPLHQTGRGAGPEEGRADLAGRQQPGGPAEDRPPGEARAAGPPHRRRQPGRVPRRQQPRAEAHPRAGRFPRRFGRRGLRGGHAEAAREGESQGQRRRRGSQEAGRGNFGRPGQTLRLRHLREALQEPPGAELPLRSLPPGRGGGGRQGRLAAPHARLAALGGAKIQEGPRRPGAAQQLLRLLPGGLQNQQEDGAARGARVLLRLRPLGAPLVPAVHPGDDGSRQDVPLAVHRVQVLQHLRHLRERRPAPLLRRLRPRLPHVLPHAPHVGAPRGELELPPVSGPAEGESLHLPEPEQLLMPSLFPFSPPLFFFSPFYFTFFPPFWVVFFFFFFFYHFWGWLFSLSSCCPRVGFPSSRSAGTATTASLTPRRDFWGNFPPNQARHVRAAPSRHRFWAFSPKTCPNPPRSSTSEWRAKKRTKRRFSLFLANSGPRASWGLCFGLFSLIFQF